MYERFACKNEPDLLRISLKKGRAMRDMAVSALEDMEQELQKVRIYFEKKHYLEDFVVCIFNYRKKLKIPNSLREGGKSA